MSKPKCRWGGPESGWLSPEHLRDCKAADCSGCRPCGEDHCAFRGRCAHHVDHAAGIITCPSCIGTVRGDLRAIAQLHAVALPSEAVEKGVDSEAFNLVGPAPAPADLAERREADEWLQGWCAIKPDPDHEPYTLLGRWDLALRETYGPPTRLRITVSRAADYLEGLLAGPFPHAPEFEVFAREVKACREHAEQVLHDSRKPEEGARCPECGKGGPRLRKRYAEGKDDKTRRGERDTWHCPANPAHWWSEHDYRARVDGAYLAHAPTLTADDMERAHGIPASTVRRWASETTRWVPRPDGKPGKLKVSVPPKIKPAGKTHDGRRLYDVAECQALHKPQTKAVRVGA